jgi:outer membrane protein assembly factor BamB
VDHAEHHSSEVNCREIAMSKEPQRAAADLVFVGLNKKVIALDRYSGELVWEWKAKKGTGFVTLLLDGDRLIASVSGYIYCLDPVFGQEVWSNPLSGFGTGYTSLASVRGGNMSPAMEAALAAQQAAAAAG